MLMGMAKNKAMKGVNVAIFEKEVDCQRSLYPVQEQTET
jgi:hypothetical protein